MSSRRLGMSSSPIESTIEANQQLVSRESLSSMPPKRGRGRPRKVEADRGYLNSENSDLSIGRSRVRKEDVAADLFSVRNSGLGTSKGYRLSDWDKFIIESLIDAQGPLINSDFMELAFEKNRNSKEVLSEDVVRGKLTRSIHKLANKRREITKINFSGKGFAYALPDWLNAKGELKTKYRR